MCLRFIVKYVMFFVNFIFALAGLALIIVGIVAFLNLKTLPVALNFLAIVIIVFGSIVFLIAFCGCCGAITESKCLLVMFSIVMALIAAFKIYVAVVVFSAVNNTQDIVEEFLHDLFRDEPNGFHVIEFVFQCCGTDGYGSYNNNSMFNEYLPPTCCEVTEDMLDIDNIQDIDIDNIDLDKYGCTRTDAFGGCVDMVSDIFDRFGRILAYVLIGLVGVEIIAMLSGIYLCCTVSKKKKHPNYY